MSIIDFEEFKAKKNEVATDDILTFTVLTILEDLTQELNMAFYAISKLGVNEKTIESAARKTCGANGLYVISRLLKTKGESMAAISKMIDRAMNNLDEEPDLAACMERMDGLGAEYEKNKDSITVRYIESLIEILDEQILDEKEFLQAVKERQIELEGEKGGDPE